GHRVVAIDSDAGVIVQVRHLGIDAWWPAFKETAIDAILFTRSLHHMAPLAASADYKRATAWPKGHVLPGLACSLSCSLLSLQQRGNMSHQWRTENRQSVGGHNEPSRSGASSTAFALSPTAQGSVGGGGHHAHRELVPHCRAGAPHRLVHESA